MVKVKAREQHKLMEERLQRLKEKEIDRWKENSRERKAHFKGRGKEEGRGDIK